MVARQKKIIIIGNGIAGNSAAAALREIDAQLDVTIISDEVEAFYSACALPYYISGEIDRKRIFLDPPHIDLNRNFCVLLGCPITRIDTANKQIHTAEQVLDYDKLILATGGRVRIPPIPGLDNAGVFTLKTLNDADKICRHPVQTVTIIGSGFIGVEAAIALQRKGCEVYLIESLDWILPRVFDEKPARFIQAIIEKHGVNILLNEKVVRIDGDNAVKGVTTDKRTIQCDMVILSTGMLPNVELARQAGLQIGALGGIQTDTHMQTSVAEIYACGDCVEANNAITGRISLSLLWPNAKQQGIIAGCNCMGISKDYAGSLDITGLCVYRTHAVAIGQTAFALDANQTEIIETGQDVNYQRLIIADGVLVGAQSIGKTEHTGMLMGMMQRKDNLSRIEDAIIQKRPGAAHFIEIVHGYLR